MGKTRKARQMPGLCSSQPSAVFLLYISGLGRGAVTENIAEIEAIAKTRREDPGIDIGVSPDAETAERRVAPRHGGVEPGLLDVGIEVPAITDVDIQARL